MADMRVGRAAIAICTATWLARPGAGGAAEPQATPSESVHGERADGEPSPGRHCLDQASALWYSEQTLVVQSAPSGAELELKAGACWPLIRDEGELFDYSRVTLGLDAQVTAGYVQVGPYIEVLPVSVLGFRAELHRVEYFPVGLSGAGYFARQSHQSPFRANDLPAADADSASGFNWVLASWLQLELELGGPFSLFVWDEAALEHWSLGSGPYYYNMRWDLLLGSSDELWRNDGCAGVRVDLVRGLTLGAGPVSSLRRVPAGDYTAHQLGGAVSSSWQPSSSALRSLDVVIALGGFAEHAFREGAFASLFVTARWDLGSL
jgi:hypothetical protein